MKLEVALLVGPETKGFLFDLKTQLDRIEKLAGGKPKPVEDDEETDDTESDDEPKAAKATTKKAKVLAEAEEQFDLGDDEEEEDKKKNTLSLKDIIAGFKAYAADNGRDEALKILKKYKVKNVNELKKDSYHKVMNDLEA